MFGGPGCGKVGRRAISGKARSRRTYRPYWNCDNRAGRAAPQSRFQSAPGKSGGQWRSAARSGRLKAKMVTPATNAMAAIIAKKAGLGIDDQKLPRYPARKLPAKIV